MRTGIVLACLLAAAPAAAEKVKVSGGPRDASATIAALEQARTMMAVCWQKRPPARVKIAVSVAASGEVTKATAKTKGAAAQCAAGILAVSTLAPSAKAWRGTVDVETVAPGKGQDVQTIHAALGRHATSFFDCQQKAPAFAGKLTLRVTVEQSGTIAAVETRAGETTGGTAADAKTVAGCVAAVARPLRLDPITSPSVTYDLALTFNGGGTAAAGAPPADPALKPSKKGPLGAEQVAPPIRARHGELARCAKASRARGKVVVRVAIAATGKAAAKIKSSELDDAKAEACLVKVLAGIAFPASTGDTVLHLPLRLDAGGLESGI